MKPINMELVKDGLLTATYMAEYPIISENDTTIFISTENGTVAIRKDNVSRRTEHTVFVDIIRRK